MAKSTKTPISVRLTAEELKLLDKAAARHGGNKTAAIVAALRQEAGANDISRETVIAWIRTHTKG